MLIYLETGVNAFHSPAAPNPKLLSVVNSDRGLQRFSEPFTASDSICISPRSRSFLIHLFRPCTIRYIGALGARVICDNIPGLVNKQRHLCQRYPDIMQAIGEGTKEWIRECQHQFRHHRWNCSTLDRDHTVFGRVLLRSKSMCVSTSACSIIGSTEILSLDWNRICS